MRHLLPALLCICCFCSTSWGSIIVATALKVSGTVDSRHPAKTVFSKLQAGTELEEGASVRTGSNGWAMLRLADGSSLTLSNSTELELTNLKLTKGRKDGVFSLLGGKIRASVVNLAGEQADIRIKSRTAVAGVKGTEFLMLSKGSANVFFGNEGKVSVIGNDDQAVLLDGNTMTQTTRGNTPLDPVQVKQGTPLADIHETFNAATGPTPPADWVAGDNLPNIIARWDINYSHYLTDRGDYRQALHLLQIAHDLADREEIKADALMERGTLFGRFLRDPPAALIEYQQILSGYKHLPQAEGALYSAAQAEYTLGNLESAREMLQSYISKHVNGKHRESAKTLLRQIERETLPKSPRKDSRKP